MTLSGLVLVSLTVCCMAIAYSKYVKVITHVRHILVQQTIQYRR